MFFCPAPKSPLRDLEDAGLVGRRSYADVPPPVEYSLTAHGRTLQPVLTTLRAWGNLHRAKRGLEPAVSECRLVEHLVEAAG